MGVNFIAVLVASVVAMVIGMAWYSESLFGKQWMKLVGMTKKDLAKAKKKGMAGMMLAGFLSNVVMAYVLAVLIGMTGAVGALGGATIAFWAWLGFIATTSLGRVLWENGKGQLWWLNNANILVTLVVMGAIIGVM